MTFEEENPEWVSMDIKLRIDPTGETDPVIITKEEQSSHSGKSGSGKDTSVLIPFAPVIISCFRVDLNDVTLQRFRTVAPVKLK